MKKLAFFIPLGIAAFIGILFIAGRGAHSPVLNPAGPVANSERWLILFVIGLGLFIVIPVFIMLFVIASRYRAGNLKTAERYEPELSHSTKLEVAWWGIPIIFIIILSIVTAIYTHKLDPYKPLVSNEKPVEVQVVALQWRWLFIYPEQGVASMNQLVIPEKRPINLTLTSDAPMNSFWLPSLSGQIYTMNGMSTKLHIMADQPGMYYGSSANISGEGFADMNFTAKSVSDIDFLRWTSRAKSASPLDQTSYPKLAQQDRDSTVHTYQLADQELYDTIVMKYMDPSMMHSHSRTDTDVQIQTKTHKEEMN